MAHSDHLWNADVESGNSRAASHLDTVAAESRRPERRDNSWADHLSATDLRALIVNLPAIEQAKGMLMGYYGIDGKVAFEVLKRWSTCHNIKLSTLCGTIIDAASRTHSEEFGALRDYLDAHQHKPTTTSPTPGQQGKLRIPQVDIDS